MTTLPAHNKALGRPGLWTEPPTPRVSYGQPVVAEETCATLGFNTIPANQLSDKPLIRPPRWAFDDVPVSKEALQRLAEEQRAADKWWNDQTDPTTPV